MQKKLIQLTAQEEAVRTQILEELRHQCGKTLVDATLPQLYKAVARVARDQIMEQWAQHRQRRRKTKLKELYYLSFEFLMGRSLANNLSNILATDTFRRVLSSMDVKLEDICAVEKDPGLGNGGLGRLAACFMDSLATMDLPAYGCSIRYENGLFAQSFVDGYQVEAPDSWLESGAVWEIPRPEDKQYVHFGGKIRTETDSEGRMRVYYENATTVIGEPYDVPVTGYHSKIVDTLRIWKASSPKDLDFQIFSGGDYLKAMEEKAMAEVLSKVLYPEDRHPEGQMLRLKQQYFFVSCTIQWIVQRFKKYHTDLHELPDYAVIHINDTHPAIGIPEMMRVLMDQEGLGWDEAWDIVTRTFAYTNHTVLNEALEKWPQELFQTLLPRIWQIVDEINNRQVARLRMEYGDDWGKINYMSVIAHGYISMANLCLTACFAINGVSGLHTEILKNDLFRDYNQLTPHRFHSITNGITFRRWLRQSNRELALLLDKSIGKEWIKDYKAMEKLIPYAEDKDFQKKFMEIKQHRKEDLARLVKDMLNIDIDPNSLFDVQVKRLHEYKRQLLNALHILYLYKKVKENPEFDMVPRTFFFGAKASPGYEMAKRIIKLINSIANLVNNDPVVSKKIKVVFIPNYGVSLAQVIIPAADISEQISTAGKEASGTGNMKFMLNGALTIGTLDGANVEMSEAVGMDNIFIFGYRAEEVRRVKEQGPSAHDLYVCNQEIRSVLDMLIDGTVCPEKPNEFKPIFDSLLQGGNADEYLVVRDFEAYVRMQEQVDRQFRDKETWAKKAILNTANAGWFSSDRTIAEYNEKIWNLKAIEE